MAQTSRRSTSPTPSALPPTTKARILVVEDEPHTAQVIQAQVEASGFDVIGIVPSGEAAIELVQQQRPDLILMDITLEGELDGIETAKTITHAYDLPVLYLTSREDREHFDRAKITEPFAYLIKPVNARELELTIEMALYRHRLQAQLRQSEKHLAAAQRIGHLGSWDLDIANNRVRLSDESQRILGVQPHTDSLDLEQFIGYAHDKDRATLNTAIKVGKQKGRAFSLYHRIQRPDGQQRIVHHMGDIEAGASGTAVRMTGTLHDVTELKNTEARLWHIAHHDPLCDLPNRMLMFDRLGQSIAHARRDKQQVALLLFDLDDFKRINDTYGHHAGDQLLIEVSQRLRRCVRDCDTISRLAGDEFTLIVDQLKAPRDAAIVAQKLIDTMQEPVSLDGQIVQVTCSIGIALYPADASDMEGLLKTADQAMYESKRCGKNAYHFYADVKRHTH